ncbi:MAG: hypothetical protein AMJ79_13540 [Phycisphaerae bacterium SM23_30]|nr:MAG: hypothetical protein AMJ79_13540 [Phycisphaerae bacterium SM23_30]
MNPVIGEANHEQLQKTQDEKDQLIDAISSIIISLDSQDRITQWNRAAEAIFGILGKDAAGRCFRGCAIEWEWEGIEAGLKQCRQESQIIRLEDIRYARPDGSEGFLGLTIHPIKKEKIKDADLLILGADITERRILKVQLAQAQKLEAIGQLASGIAHEINTPIQYIGDNIRFLKDGFDDLITLLEKYNQLLAAVQGNAANEGITGEIVRAAAEIDLDYLATEMPRAIEQSQEGVERVIEIVRAMKEFAHPGVEEKTSVDLNRALESTLTVARNEWKYVADLQKDFDSDLPLVSCLPGELNQVILNLIVNAAHAISEVIEEGSGTKGTITVSTRKVGAEAEIRVSDTGAGIPEEIRTRIFEPFFTTKDIGKGSGQGLALAHAVIVEKHGGTIHFESETGRGTTFIIRLPMGAVADRQEMELSHAR